MKTFVAILAIVASVGTFILFENVNGEEAPFTLISSDGSYTPGNGKMSFLFTNCLVSVQYSNFFYF